MDRVLARNEFTKAGVNAALWDALGRALDTPVVELLGGPFRTTVPVKMSLVETERPKHAVYEGNGDVPGGSATLRAAFELELAAGGATKVIWSGQSNVMGRIASLAGGLLQPLAKKNVQKLIDGLQKALT